MSLIHLKVLILYPHQFLLGIHSTESENSAKPLLVPWLSNQLGNLFAQEPFHLTLLDLDHVRVDDRIPIDQLLFGQHKHGPNLRN